MTPETTEGIRPSRISRIDARLPEWLVRNPLYWGWGWACFWLAVLIALDEFFRAAGWTWYLPVAAAALPSLLSTLAVLHITPRQQVKAARESVLGLFFVRFLALIAAFMVWAISVVLSASISTTVQAVAGDSEREVTALGFKIMAALFPFVVAVLWLAFLARCAWFLKRLRGWRQVPTLSRVPKSFLCGRPRLRRVVIGLAHPGLMLLAGVGASLLAFVLGPVELTIEALL